MPFAQPPLEFHQSLNTPFHPLELQLEKFEQGIEVAGPLSTHLQMHPAVQLI